MQFDISIEAPWPSTTDWKALVARVAEAVAEVAPELANPRLRASILLTDDEEVHALNQQWRSKDKPTNVLSFPMISRDELLNLPSQGPPELIGDIVLALGTCSREASEKSAKVEDHAAHLIAHGLLHLAGFDHERGLDEADRMEALETKALAIMGIEDPYGRLA